MSQNINNFLNSSKKFIHGSANKTIIYWKPWETKNLINIKKIYARRLMKINNLDDIKNFLKEYNGKKIFIISGRKSYKLSTAEKI